jgi:hypothetical protein
MRERGVRDYIVRATCPGCGDVVLTTGDLSLQVDRSGSRFSFACPRCHDRVSHDIPTGIVHILQAAGVESIEPEPDPISDEELGAFLADFERADCVDQLRRLSREI